MAKYQARKIAVSEMRPNLRGAVRTVSYIPERDCNKNPNGALYLRKNVTNSKLSCFKLLPVEDTAEGVRFNVISSKKQEPSNLRKDAHAPMSSGNTQSDDFGRRSVFYPRWGNRICSITHKHSEDEDLLFKHTSLLPPVSNPACSVNRTESPLNVTKSCTLLRIKSNLATLKLTTIGPSYADPVLGASASFIQRLLEMSTLQEKTVRQEKLKELKKNRRLES